MKPRLPYVIEQQLPEDIVKYIATFVPHYPKPTTPKISPSLEKELQKIQTIQLRGKSPMYMKDLDDFIENTTLSS